VSKVVDLATRLGGQSYSPEIIEVSGKIMNTIEVSGKIWIPLMCFIGL